jgi:secreted trypsin-like serine protease
MRALSGGTALLIVGVLAGTAVAGSVPAQSIVGGEPADPQRYPATGMVIRRVPGGQFLNCTATLIAPDIAVTAAHCIPLPYPGVGLEFSLDLDGRDGFDDKIPVLFAHAHPDYRAQRTDTLELTNAADLGVLILATPITSVVPEQIDGEPDVAELRSGMQLELVGYGVTKSTSNDPSGLKQQAMVTIDRAEQFELNTTIQGPQPCYGDSGAPLFTVGTGPRRLIGVVSRAYGAITTCDSGAIVTRLVPYSDWIARAAADRDNHYDAGGDCSAGRGGLGTSLAALWPALSALSYLRRRKGRWPDPGCGSPGGRVVS